MSFAGLAICLIALVGNAEQALDHPVSVSMVAVHATKEGRPEGEKVFDPDLKAIRAALKELPFDTFRKVKANKGRASAKEEVRLTINDQFTLSVTPLSHDSDRRVRVKARIEEKVEKDGKKVTRKAVDTTSALVPGKPLVLVVPLKEGALVVLLTVDDK